ncbi:MAG: sugar phosphate nucleotidyltransferase [Thiohalomonadales bacterium]
MKSNNQPVTEAIILAGGLGSRLRSEVPDLPKPMAPVANRPFLEYLMDYLHKLGFLKIIMSVGYKHTSIVQHFGKNYSGMSIEYAIEEEPLGTGGGTLLAGDKVSGNAPVVVLNGDTWFPVDLIKMVDFHHQRKCSLTIAVHSLVNPGRFTGVKIGHNQKIVDFCCRDNNERQWINGGIYVISPHIFEQWRKLGKRPSALENDLIPNCIEGDAAVYAFLEESPFIDIGVPADYKRASSILNCT